MPVLIERERPSKRQLKAVHAYIMRRKEKEKQALAESKAKEEAEKQRKREQEKKKETVEDVKLEIDKLESKLESLKNEKHQLFLQLKKVLNEDEEKRQRERLASVMIPPPPPHTLIPGGVHRMPYAMMGSRPYSMTGNIHVPDSNPINMTGLPVSRMVTPAGTGGAKSPIQSQVYPNPHPGTTNQTIGSLKTQGYPYSCSVYSGEPGYSHGQGGTSHVQHEKHLKPASTCNTGQVLSGNPVTQPISTPISPLHVVTSYSSSSTTQNSPYTQQSTPLGGKHHPVMLSPEKSSSASHTQITQAPSADIPSSHHGKVSLHQTTTQQQTSKQQHPNFQQHIQTTQQSGNLTTLPSTQSPKYKVVHQKHQPHLLEQQHKKHYSAIQTHSKPEVLKPEQQQTQHEVNVQSVPDAAPHKQPQQYSTSVQLDQAKQDHSQVRPHQYGVHSYQQQQQQPVQYPKLSTQIYTAQSTANQPAKKQEPDQQEHPSSVLPTQQTYGYPMVQQTHPQQQTYTEQQYLPKNETQQQQAQTNTQVSYQSSTVPVVQAQQANYQAFTSIQEQPAPVSKYTPQQTGYQIPTQQQVYSGQPQYQQQAYLPQQYQGYGYSIPVDPQGQQQHQTGTQNYQTVATPSQPAKIRQTQFDQNKLRDQQMPPPPPQRPPPKHDQPQTSPGGHISHYGEHGHQGHQSSKRSSSHRYNPYLHNKRDHHQSSSSTKSKYSDKHSGSQDDQSGSSSHSSRHHHHPSSKSSHSKSSGQSQRQSRYH